MPVGSGDTWDETNPTNSTIATSIDDYDRDLRIGTRSRMAIEHEWPASQSSTAQAGQHKFITLQNQAAKPTVSGTQLAAIYSKTVGSGLQELFYENEAGTEVQLTNRSSPGPQIPSVVAMTYSNLSTVIVNTDLVPFDNSIPQITEGTQAFSLGINVPSTTHAVKVSGVLNLAQSGNSANVITYSLFQDTTANAKATFCKQLRSGESFCNATPYQFIVAPTTTGTVTYSIRAGADAGVMVINAKDTAAVYGGVFYSNMLVEVYKTA